VFRFHALASDPFALVLSGQSQFPGRQVFHLVDQASAMHTGI